MADKGGANGTPGMAPKTAAGPAGFGFEVGITGQVNSVCTSKRPLKSGRFLLPSLGQARLAFFFAAFFAAFLTAFFVVFFAALLAVFFEATPFRLVVGFTVFVRFDDFLATLRPAAFFEPLFLAFFSGAGGHAFGVALTADLRGAVFFLGDCGINGRGSAAASLASGMKICSLAVPAACEGSGSIRRELDSMAC